MRIHVRQGWLAVSTGPVRQKFCSHFLPALSPFFPPIHEAWPSISVTLLAAIYLGRMGWKLSCSLICRKSDMNILYFNKETLKHRILFCTVAMLSCEAKHTPAPNHHHNKYQSVSRFDFHQDFQTGRFYFHTLFTIDKMLTIYLGLQVATKRKLYTTTVHLG